MNLEMVDDKELDLKIEILEFDELCENDYLNFNSEMFHYLKRVNDDENISKFYIPIKLYYKDKSCYAIFVIFKFNFQYYFLNNIEFHFFRIPPLENWNNFDEIINNFRTEKQLSDIANIVIFKALKNSEFSNIKLKEFWKELNFEDSDI